jgi:membrane-associated phospholipid phosphatase
MAVGQIKAPMKQAGYYPSLRFRHVAARLVGGGLLLAFVLVLIGWAIVNLATPSALTRWEDSVNQWFYAGRTPTLDMLTHIGSSLSNTTTCIAVLVVAVVVLRLWLGRWRESWTVAAAIIGELWVFLIVTLLVNRPRPSVPLLDVAPPTSSFPSGHTGAAVALYGCLAVIFLRWLRPKWLAAALAIVLWVIPVVVGVSRLYRGMHHPTDVFFGALAGGAWLAIVLTTLLPRHHDGFDGDGVPVINPPRKDEGVGAPKE